MSDVPASSSEAELPRKPSIGFRRIARGAVWSWSRLVLTAAVAFFVAPYVVHHLGSTAYGVWILVSSVVSYMALLDLGIRGAVVRFVSADHPRGLHDEASKAVSAALWFRLWVSAVLLIATVGLSFVATTIFHIPPELHTATRVAILLSGANLALSLTLSVFAGVLNALHRFDLLSVAAIAQSLLTSAGFVVLLGRGRGIVALALWQLIVGLLNGLFLYKAAFRIYPQLTLTFRAPGRELMQKFGSYSLFLFLNAVGSQVIYYTDNVVIGAVLPVSAVTLYALGFAPTQYLRQIVASLSTTFLPAASNLAAQGHNDQLRRLLIQGTRALMAVALPIEVALFIRGKTFISLWMGPQYGEISGHVLQVLILSWFFISGNACSSNIVYGLSKHKAFAIGSIFEAIANLSLSVFLVRRWGVIGVAWGTTLSGLILNAVIWPRYIAKILDIPLLRYLFQSWLRPAVAIIPFAVGCLVAERWWPAKNLAGFFLQMAALVPLVPAGLALVFRRELGTLLRVNGWLLGLRRIQNRPDKTS
jgi:O-antigen/teichoic acid export membrane protein